MKKASFSGLAMAALMATTSTAAQADDAPLFYGSPQDALDGMITALAKGGAC